MTRKKLPKPLSKKDAHKVVSTLPEKYSKPLPVAKDKKIQKIISDLIDKITPYPITYNRVVSNHLRNYWNYQNRDYPSGMIFDFFSCGPAANPKKNGKVILKGAYPHGFLKRLKTAMSPVWPDKKTKVLHVCSGSVDKKEGLRLDSSNQFKPDILANAEIFADAFLKRFKPVKISIAAPPYNHDTAKEYYKQKNKLNVIKMLRQMAEVTELFGFVILLDQTSPSIGMHVKGLKRVALIGVTSVPNQDCRLCTVWQKVA